MSSSSKTIIILLLILAILGFAVYHGYFPTKLGNVAEFDKIEQEIPSENNFEGSWELRSVLKNCINEERLNGVEVLYQIEITQNRKSVIKGTGKKIGEWVNGKFVPLSHKDVLLEGIIKNGQLVAKLFENGLDRELTGEMNFDVENSRFEYHAEYKGIKGNCDGDAVLKRKN
ncbi:MAG: hypothetical protein KDC85_09645 [Saprospiraceae bacterium]|nr:hypothetical protein [Saprospiraceae bacterium]MCB9322941.1 hypothetical protein [Lewinellaceae bacterium]